MLTSPDAPLPEDNQNPTTPSQEEEDTLSPTEHTASAEIATEQPLLSESLLPPEAQGETHGGPLGCCLGTVVGLLLTFLLITSISVSLSNGGFLGFATLPGAIIGAILGGFFGWKIGKLIYREYELSPRQKQKLAQLERKQKPGFHHARIQKGKCLPPVNTSS